MTPAWRLIGWADSVRAYRAFLRPFRWASSIVSSAVTSNTRRLAGVGPCRKDMMSKAPGLSNATMFDIACLRSFSARCAHTAVTSTRSKTALRVMVLRSIGRLSSSHSIWLEGWSLAPASRSGTVGSTARMQWPFVASQAASIPVPAPISKILLAFAGSKWRTALYFSAKGTPSYRGMSDSASSK